MKVTPLRSELDGEGRERRKEEGRDGKRRGGLSCMYFWKLMFATLFLLYGPWCVHVNSRDCNLTALDIEYRPPPRPQHCQTGFILAH